MKNFSPIRIFVFVIATVALAKFFEAGRLIADEKTFTHITHSIFSFLIFVFALLVLGYWVYKEEKEKNNIKHTFGLYEWFYKLRGQNK